MPFKPTWKESAEFVCEETGVFVRVTNTNHKIPQWSIAGFGRYKVLPNGNQVPVNYILLRAEHDNVLSGELDYTFLEAFEDQLDAAVSFIASEHRLACQHVRELEAEKEKTSDEVREPRNVVNKGAGRRVAARQRQSVKTETAPESREGESAADDTSDYAQSAERYASA